MDEAMPAERWVPVAGWEHHYEVSDQGRVRSQARVVQTADGKRRHMKPKLRRFSIVCHGRYYVVRFVDRSVAGTGRDETKYVHTLVAVAFLGERPADMECLHGPGGSLDNRVTNLRWGSHVENMQDKKRDGTVAMSNRSQCPRRHPLVAPNLVPSKLRKGRRGCLACARASSRWHSDKRTEGRTSSAFVALADAYFGEIMRNGR